MIRLLKKMAGEEESDSQIINQFKKDYNQEETIRLLKKIAGEDKLTPDNKETIIDPFDK